MAPQIDRNRIHIKFEYITENSFRQGVYLGRETFVDDNIHSQNIENVWDFIIA